MKKDCVLKLIVLLLLLIVIGITGYLFIFQIETEKINDQVNVNLDNLRNKEILSINQTNDNATSLNVDQIENNLNNVQNKSLTEEEVKALYYMEEEEKLAHDVYVALGNIWGAKIFSNISQAEQTHMDATTAVLEAYGYPSKRNEELGNFNNETLQEYYEALVGDGSVLDVEAILVGGMIEELDIKDINEYLEIVENEDIIFLFENLRKGSENHLRAFVRNYEKTGETYFPQILENSYFQSIINK